jgi:hypothetical protein
MLAMACFALVWVTARACLQSVTIDEADSYLFFATPEPDWAAYWYPSSGNHVLYNILSRLLTSLFGLSHLTLRGAAILGAAVYIASIYGLCLWITREHIVRWPLFVCLVYNPFVMDYLVAARGYSLALGFLTAALLVMARSSTNAAWSAASTLIGLSLAANFSFGYVDAAALLALLLWACARTRTPRTALACLAPACLAVLFLCGHTLLNFPRSQLYYGAGTLGEMWNSVVDASFDELNPFVVNPLVARCLTLSARWLPRLFVALCVLQIGAIALAGRWRRELRFAAALAGIAAGALIVHWLAFRVARIPLPMARTAIFFVPLTVLFLGIAAGRAVSRFQRVLRVATIAVVCTAAVYFIGCLRLSHFKEWQFDEDVKEAFGVLRQVHRRQGICEIPSDWRYSSALNFYRRYYREESMPPFVWEKNRPADKRAYVSYFPDDQAFIESRHLKIVYKGKHSDLVIAVENP